MQALFYLFPWTKLIRHAARANLEHDQAYDPPGISESFQRQDDRPQSHCIPDNDSETTGPGNQDQEAETSQNHLLR